MGLLRGMARVAVVSGTATAVSNNVSRRQAARYQEADAAAAPVAAAPQVDVAGQLQQLAALKDQGILTEEEFSAKKAQLLGL